MTVEEWLGPNNTLGYKIWENKYRHNGESFDAFLDRVSGGNESIRQQIAERKFIFGGRILANRGLQNEGRKITYSNCYVIKPPEDNIEDIYRAAKDLARTYACGGGCGVDISKLSPRGAKINNAAKTTSGAVSFMELYDTTTGLVSQNGRRGALMISMDCTHPDLEEFIKAKEDVTRLNNCNISVKMTDEFMKAVENDEDFELYFKRPETGEEIRKTVKANDIFNKLCEMNWRSGEPGILFWDRIKNYNLLSEDEFFEYAGVNPCAEEPLPAGGSCLLGAINLAEFVKDGEIDFKELQKTVRDAVDALNQVLDEGLNLHPLECQRESVRDWRQIGLGIMGLADMFIKLGVEYGSPESIFISKRVGEFISGEAIYASFLLATTDGSYPMCDMDSVAYSEYFDKATARLSEDKVDFIKRNGLRNSQLLTIAPTGSISNLFGVSNGIEPLFATHYTRKTESLDGKTAYYEVYPKIVQDYLNEKGLAFEALPTYFVTADKIDYRNRIQVQAAWQEYIDASISSTINVPNSFPVSMVRDLYLSAWHAGLKGVTIFRAGCERDAVLTTEDERTAELKKVVDEACGKDAGKYDYLESPTRKDIGTTHGDTFVKKCACGTLYITVNTDDDGNIVEVFVNTSKRGTCKANIGAVTRLLSKGLQTGMKVSELIDAIKGIECGACTKAKEKGEDISGISCPDIIAKTIHEFRDKRKQLDLYSLFTPAKIALLSIKEDIKYEICPECGERTLEPSGQCPTCINCGYHKCD